LPGCAPLVEIEKKYNLICIVGPTASGKTQLAVKVADWLDSEIISADSRQVYIGMDIGTGKDLHAYKISGRTIPHHVIDIIEPTEDFSVFDFQRYFFESFNSITAKDRVPVLAGGTGLYLDCVLGGYRMAEVPENQELRKKLSGLSLDELTAVLRNLGKDLHNVTDTLQKDRAIRAIEIRQYEKDNPEIFEMPPSPIRSLTFGITCDRDALRDKIRRRLRERIEAGMIFEAERLHEAGIPWERFEYFGLEYRYMANYLQRRISLPEMEEELATRIGQFAKRQETWFHKMEREGLPIIWVHANDDAMVFRILHEEGFA